MYTSSMQRYVALLRGIGPGNPSMTSTSLKGFFESLGYRRVMPVISSGNVVFDTSEKDAAKLEAVIEKALPEKLGFSRIAIVRSKAELEKLVKKNPFKGVVDDKKHYLVITFFKEGKKGVREIATVIDTDDSRTPDFMREVEKKYGKDITTRTWKTVYRILKKMDS